MKFVADTIKIPKRRLPFSDRPLVMLLREGKPLIELYFVDEEGREEYSGILDHHLELPDDGVAFLVKKIRSRILERPFSVQALEWLAALKHHGLLEMYEELLG